MDTGQRQQYAAKACVGNFSCHSLLFCRFPKYSIFIPNGYILTSSLSGSGQTGTDHCGQSLSAKGRPRPKSPHTLLSRHRLGGGDGGQRLVRHFVHLAGDVVLGGGPVALGARGGNYDVLVTMLFFLELDAIQREILAFFSIFKCFSCKQNEVCPCNRILNSAIDLIAFFQRTTYHSIILYVLITSVLM